MPENVFPKLYIFDFAEAAFVRKIFLHIKTEGLENKRWIICPFTIDSKLKNVAICHEGTKTLSFTNGITVLPSVSS